MTEQSKPEINIEIFAGFFRIPTGDAIYNITVLDSQPNSVTRVMEKIVLSEKAESGESVSSESEQITPATPISGDDFYKAVSQEVFNDIGQLARSLSDTIMEIPAEDRESKRVELDEAGEKIEEAKSQLKDIVSMTEKATMDIMDHVEQVQAQTNDVKDILSLLKEHEAFKTNLSEDASDAIEDDVSGVEKPFNGKLAEIQKMIGQAKELTSSILQDKETPQQEEIQAEPVAEKRKRYLFDLDTVFQTIYELCTNETVKKHVSTARENAADIFNRDAFIETISPKVEALPQEDGFISAPLSVVLQSLYAACSDKKIQNLLKKMDGEKESIFLDQALPLEMPPAEEAEEEPAVSDIAAADENSQDARIVELDGLLQETQEIITELSARKEETPAGAGKTLMSLDCQNEIFQKIENAFDVVANICGVVSRITETLSFQDLAGQQIMKIIKLLSDFQVQLLAIVVSFGSRLKQKQKNAEITVEESKKLAQNDVDAYLNKFKQTDAEGPEMLDQDSVNQMLDELGFG